MQRERGGVCKKWAGPESNYRLASGSSWRFLHILINESLLNPGVTIRNIRKQCCGSGMIIPDPDFSITDSGSRVKNEPDPESATKDKYF